MRSAIILALLASTAGFVRVDDARAADSYTVNQCIQILTGLNSLNFVGQVTPQTPQSAGQKSYKFGGGISYTIASDVSELVRINDAATKAESSFERTLPPPIVFGNSPTPEQVQAKIARDNQINDNWDSITSQPCSAKLDHLKWSDLKVGDNSDQNQIPPSPLSLIFPILDHEK